MILMIIFISDNIMSIVLRANQLNTILYKYLLEAGLNHTAFTLFNEAALAQPLQEFRFDVRPGHLLSLLERALVYAQIEAHVSLSEYVQCNEPFHLLKSHTCNVVERVRREKEQLLKELGEQIDDSIKRTNSAYNTAIANRDYDDIPYEAQGSKYLDRFLKIRLPPSDTDKPMSYIVKGTAQAPLLHNTQDFEVDLLRYDALNEEIVVDQIFPCISQGKFQHPVDFACAGEFMVQLYPSNKVTVFRLRNDNLEPVEFVLEGGEAQRVQPNVNLPQLVALTGRQQFWVVNLNSMKLMAHEKGMFAWKEYNEYLLINNNSLSLNILCQPQPTLTFATQRAWSKITFNPQKSLYALVSFPQKIVEIHTFQNSEPLFLFDLSEEKSLKQTLWINSNSVDYFCWLTDGQIKIFDLSLNSYSKIIEIAQYDSQVHGIATLRKAERDECFLIALGSKNILAFDITNSKIEGILTSGKSGELSSLGSERLALTLSGSIYFLTGQLIEPLFK